MVICKESVFKEAFDGLTPTGAGDKMKCTDSKRIRTFCSGNQVSFEEADEAGFQNYQSGFQSVLGFRLAIAKWGFYTTEWSPLFDNSGKLWLFNSC